MQLALSLVCTLTCSSKVADTTSRESLKPVRGSLLGLALSLVCTLIYMYMYSSKVSDTTSHERFEPVRNSLLGPAVSLAQVLSSSSKTAEITSCELSHQRETQFWNSLPRWYASDSTPSKSLTPPRRNSHPSGRPFLGNHSPTGNVALSMVKYLMTRAQYPGRLLQDFQPALPDSGDNINDFGSSREPESQ